MKRHYILMATDWILIFAWLGVIYFFSNQPNLKSEFEPLIDLLLRKIAHLAEYFVLAYLFFRLYRSSHIPANEALILTLVGAIVAASLDEYHQLSVAGRVGSIKDITVDFLGSLAFVGLHLNETKKLL